MTFGERIKQRREALAIRPERVAAECNVSRACVDKWERMTKATMSIENAMALAGVLEFGSVEEMLGKAGDTSEDGAVVLGAVA